MTRIILIGCNGKMGFYISNAVACRDDCKIVAGVDINTACSAGYPVYTRIDLVNEEADVIIDFSNPVLLPSILSYSQDKKIPAVLSTTGYSEQQVESIKSASTVVPIFYSGNMSLGINLLLSLVKKASSILGAEFDIEILEKHHNQKIDAPSGTALMIANAICESSDLNYELEYDRHSKVGKRSRNEIGIHSVRGGTIVGEHEVIFAGNDEVISIKHEAHSKGVFATGAINASLFLAKQKPGLYDMSDLVSFS